MHELDDHAQVAVAVASGRVKTLPDSRDTRAITRVQNPEVRRRYESGQSVNEIARRMGITPSEVRRRLGLPPAQTRKAERRGHRLKHRRHR